MRICIIAEGSYPYITGGVSSWIHMLINWMPEHEFVIFAIGADEADKGKFKYKLPQNVIEVQEVFLNSYLNDTGKWGKRFKTSLEEKNAIKQFLVGNEFDWDKLFSFILSLKGNSVSDFLMSKDFFDILEDVYKEKYSMTSFVDYFWTLRSMFLPLFLVMNHHIPKADLYHSVSTGYAGIVGSIGSYIYQKPFILTEHGIYTREREEEIIKSSWVKGHFKNLWIDFFRSLSKCAYMKAEKVITLFNRNKEIEIELGCDENKIEIIPNGVNVEDFKGIAQKDPDDKFINIGAIVRIVPIKDIKTLIQAFALVKNYVKNAKLYIMGPANEDMEYYEECTKLVELLRVKDIVFTGGVNIKDYVGKMDILVLSSISEGQPLAILEGMACSRPFVTTDVGCCRELLYGLGDDKEEAGIVVPVMDYEKMGAALVQLCKNPELREKMGKTAFRRVKELYNKERFISSYKNLYKFYEGVK